MEFLLDSNYQNLTTYTNMIKKVDGLIKIINIIILKESFNSSNVIYKNNIE
jgi:hypothetical protein